MATKTQFKKASLVSRGSIDIDYCWEMKRSADDRQIFFLAIIKKEVVDDIKITKEMRLVPTELFETRPETDQKGKPLKDEDGNDILEVFVNKTHTKKEIEVREEVKRAKLTPVKIVEFAFRPLPLQVKATVKILVKQIREAEEKKAPKTTASDSK